MNNQIVFNYSSERLAGGIREMAKCLPPLIDALVAAFTKIMEAFHALQISMDVQKRREMYYRRYTRCAKNIRRKKKGRR